MTRTELEAHPSFPFSDFRTSTASFLLLELYWPAVLRPVLGALADEVVPLGEADQDVDGFGTPNLLYFWLPRRGRGLRLMYNNPPFDELRDGSDDAADAETDDRPAHSRLFAAAEIHERPSDWPLPDGGQLDSPATRAEMLVLIADTDPRVADAVAEAARAFLTTDISLADMQAACARLETQWQL
jgi:hypothetical protein